MSSARLPVRRRKPPTAPKLPDSRAIDVVLVGDSLALDAEFVVALQHLETSDVLRVCAVVDPAFGPGTELATSFPEAELTRSLDSVNRPPGGLVILATPPHLHSAQAGAAAKRGWHVLSLAPLAPNMREATALAAAVRRHERVLAVDLHWRYFPCAQFLRSLCRDQLLGPLLRFSIHDGAPVPFREGAQHCRTKPEWPNGVLLDIGVRSLDLLGWCLGSTTLASYADDAMGGVEANAYIELASPEGVRGTIHLSRAWPTSETCHFVFERGIVRCSLRHANRITLQIASAPAGIDGALTNPLGVDEPAARPALLPSRSEAIAGELRHIIAAIGGVETLRLGPAEASRTTALIDECYARRTLLNQPWLSHNELARARSLSMPSGLPRP